jgi:hypothetical protein
MADLSRLLKIGDFEIDRHALSDQQLLLLLIAIDPSEEQKVILDTLDIKILDYNGKSIYPRD